MKVYVQWARRNPEDWVNVEHTDLNALPARPVPTVRQTGNDEGWVQAVNVQGVVLENWDHYGIRPVVVGIEPGLEVHVWNDDPDDWPEPFGQVWTFLDPAPDPSLNGIVNTRQTMKVYGPESWTSHWEGVTNATRHSWSEWPTNNGQVRHGVWQSDVSYERGQQVRSFHGWEEWASGT